VSEGHLLLVPRRHVPTWFDATADEQAALVAAPPTPAAASATSSRAGATT
jgi:diadenosine tetraphosphate (Ap4A) HIT family hydrolase